MTKAVFVPGQQEISFVTSPEVAASADAANATAESAVTEVQPSGYDGIDPREERRADILRETMGWSPDRVERATTGVAETAVGSVMRSGSEPRLRHARLARPHRRPYREPRYGDEVGANFPNGQPAEHQSRILFDAAGRARFERGITLIQQVLDDRGIGRNS